jgi:hypothetical protein
MNISLFGFQTRRRIEIPDVVWVQQQKCDFFLTKKTILEVS